MKILGWIIWWFACLLLLDSLYDLRKEKGRSRRLFFCVCTAVGLALTYFTSFSKFHLLWILLLRLILPLLLFGMVAAFAYTYYRINRRKPERQTISAEEFPPFGALVWGKSDAWEGRVRLPAWAGFQSRGGAYGSEDSDSPADGSAVVTVNPDLKAPLLTPTEAQCRAMKFQIEHGEKVVQSVLAALLPRYRKLKKNCETDDEQMPPVSAATDFQKMIGLSQVHVLRHERDGLAHVGLEFGCVWDDEHGLGIVLHGASVVKIGEADTAFTWQPKKPQNPTPAGPKTE